MSASPRAPEPPRPAVPPASTASPTTSPIAAPAVSAVATPVASAVTKADASRIYGGPLRYLQGPGVLDQVGQACLPFGRSAVLVADPFVLELVGARLAASFEAAGVTLVPVAFGGEITPAEVGRLAGRLAAESPDVVIAAGGGKGIDCGKAVAQRLGARVITVPTVASNDAPTSKIFVVYDEQHRLLAVEHLPHNPVAVIVDTALIARAPARLLLAGIGDALSKKFEVERCAAARGRNIFGGLGTQAALALADLSYRVVREQAAPALAAVAAGRSDDALEALVEATVLLSGLCFENGGLSIAHAMTRGLSAVPATAGVLHGLQVAYGLMVQLTLEQREPAFLDELAAFYQAIGLPRSLGELGLGQVGQAGQSGQPEQAWAPGAVEIRAIAEGTMTAPHVKNFPHLLNAEAVAAAIRAVEDRYGAPAG